MHDRTPPTPLGLSVAAALLCGVTLLQLAPSLPPVWLAAGLSTLLFAGFVRRPRLRIVCAFLFGVAWASVWGQHAMQSRWQGDASRDTWRLSGHVVGLPVLDANGVRFDFRMDAGEPASLVGEKLRLGWYGRQEGLEPGSRWEFDARLKRPRGVLNAGGYDAERQAIVQRIAATGYVRADGRALSLADGAGIDRWRDAIAQQMASALPDGRDRFVRALAIGDTRGLGDEDWEILRSTGLTHQIAISGFHVGMVAGFGSLCVLGLYRVLPGWGRRVPRPQAAAIGAFAFALAYSALAGFALPTVRTLLMIAAVAALRMLRRPQRAQDAIALALIVVMLFDPLSVLTPGFWLSFIGVAWLLWCLPQPRESGLLRSFLQAQSVAVLGLLPLTIWFFGQASLSGPIANLVGIPVISLLVVPLCLLGLLLSLVWKAAAVACWQLAAFCMEGLWHGLELLASSPATLLWLPEPSLAAFALACIGAFWLLMPRAVAGKWLAILLFLPLVWPATFRPALREAEIVVLDVGQGSSVLIRTQNYALLLDAGPASERGLDYGEAAVVPALRALAVARLDRLMLSHGDNDHAGGAGAVLAAFPEAGAYAPEGWAPVGSQLCRRGDRWRWDGVDFQVLHPPPLFPYLRNDSSCVLRVEASGRVALLPGDIGKYVEARLQRENAAGLRADWLLVPHHGSETSSTGEFISAVAPAWAVVSAGADNRFGLPRETVLQRYRHRNARILNTADAGMLRFALRADGVHLLEARRTHRPRYWRDRPDASQAMLSAIPPKT
ncbi:DNA internalization-related competence protein ComEC/Rec2 [Arenimonas sp.]|uniref:DNA internalization-related competence protein ComEC/Rec2 n=1 Tax=Arenimonas sp. TaxID=1872635 RepID=UPI0039E52B3F